MQFDLIANYLTLLNDGFQIYNNSIIYNTTTKRVEQTEEKITAVKDNLIRRVSFDMLSSYQLRLYFLTFLMMMF